jgi:queuine tRNA-ribosyltransferase
MGVGTSEDIITGVLAGVDLFDCVFPTRLARNHAAFTRDGTRLNLRNAPFARDPAPIDPTCNCYTCQKFSRAYLRHLIVAKEMLSATLLSIHNLHTLIQLTRDLRQSILDNELDEFITTFNPSPLVHI